MTNLSFTASVSKKCVNILKRKKHSLHHSSRLTQGSQFESLRFEINHKFLSTIVEPAEDGCHPECMNGCKKSNGGNNAPATSDMCYACQHFNFTGYCVPLCPVGTYETPDKLCSPCSKACATCYGGLPSQCVSCGQKKLLLYSRSFQRTGLKKFSLLARNISFL